MKIYESIIIVNSSLNEETLNRIVTRCEEVIKRHGGKLRNTILWGKRRLAYPIRKFQYGHYIIFEFESPSELVNELEREYRLNEHILRYLTLHKDKKAILAEQKRKSDEEKMRAAETSALIPEVLDEVIPSIIDIAEPIENDFIEPLERENDLAPGENKEIDLTGGETAEPTN